MGAKDSKFVHVALPDGKVKLYDEPLPVGELLKQFPDHYVTTVPIHQMYSWAACLHSEQLLEPGNLYFVRPVPSEDKSSKSEQDTHHKPESKALEKADSFNKRKVGKRKGYKRTSVLQCYSMLSCVHPQTSPIHLAIAARMNDRSSGNPLHNSMLEFTEEGYAAHSGKFLPIQLTELIEKQDEEGDAEAADHDECGIGVSGCDDSEDTVSEGSSEGDMEFLQQQLQLYGVSRPTGLDMRLSFKWKPALPSIVEFADLPPKFQKKLCV